MKPGSYSATAERVGYVIPRGSSAQVTAKPGEDNTDFQLQMEPVGAISGRITDAEGKPVEGATVEAETAVFSGESTTDEKGQFRIGGLAPGRYRIRASYAALGFDTLSPQEIRSDGTVDVRNAATWFPGVLPEKLAGKVEVRPGTETPGADVQLVGVPFVRVSGKAMGMPPGAAHAFVSVGSRAMRGGQGIPLNPDGSFEVWGLGPGPYTVSAGWDGAGGRPALWGNRVETTANEIELAGSNIDGIELHAVPDSDIAGRLESNPQSSAQPQARMVTLSALGSSQIVSRAPIGDDDTFHLEGVSAARYLVGISWDIAYIKSMFLGSMAIDGAVLDLRNGSGAGDLVLRLSPATGSVSGTVYDDRENAVEARVGLIADDENRGFSPRWSSAAGDGSYSFPNLPPGNYKLLALPQSEADLIVRWGGLMDYPDEMDRAAIREGANTSLDLRRRVP